MILLFLGSWRSTLIVCISIPLSILTSLIVLSITGNTVNIMTLGGLALAVGILVDDATVEIENTHRNMGMKKPLVKAVLDGAQQVAVPAFVSTLAICIVFVPVLLLTGAAKYLFTPLGRGRGVRHAGVVPALAHADSRTWCITFLRKEMDLYREGENGEPAEAPGWNWKIHHAFNRRFDRFPRPLHAACSTGLWTIAAAFLIVFGVFVVAIDGPGVLHRPRLLPDRGFRADPFSRAAAFRNADRGIGTVLRRASSREFAKSFRRTNWTPFSTTSACPTAASILRSAITRCSAIPTATSWCR